MKYDTDKIDDAVLALMLLGIHDGARAWKGFDWESMNRLHEKKYIGDPRSKTKSVALLGDAARRSNELFEKHFGRK